MFGGPATPNFVQRLNFGRPTSDGMAVEQRTRTVATIRATCPTCGDVELSSESDAMRASAGEFILEGLYAHKRISRNEELEFVAGERSGREERLRDEREDVSRRGFDQRRGSGGTGGGRRNLN